MKITYRGVAQFFWIAFFACFAWQLFSLATHRPHSLHYGLLGLIAMAFAQIWELKEEVLILKKKGGKS